ncbi:unnamed protein product [Musa acuminata var. zebrina]
MLPMRGPLWPHVDCLRHKRWKRYDDFKQKKEYETNSREKRPNHYLIQGKEAYPTQSSHPHRGAEGPETRPAFTVDGADEDECLRRSDVLSREEVLRRRARRLKQLAGCHSRQFWALMEEVRVKHRDYYWEHGVSPFEEGEEDGDGGGGRGREAGENGGAVGGAVEGREDNRMARVGVGLGLGFGKGEGSGGRRGERNRCAFAGCKSKAMPLTRFCHPHILADKKQTLYKACSYVTRSGQSGPITCGKPVLRVAVPSLCQVHFQKTQKSITQALKRAGHNVSSRPAPKFSILIAEYIHQIQSRRRDAVNSAMGGIEH